MPHLRAVGHLLPLRNPYLGQIGKKCAPNLLDHHQTHHPHEIYLKPETHKPIKGLAVAGYNFFGQFVRATKAAKPNVNVYAPYMRISEVAALALEQTFGGADTLEEVFTVPWGMPESRNQGKVFWDTTNDRIIAKTREGFILAMEGTNLIEAAVYLPRIYQEIKQRLIPEGADIIELKIEGQEEWSLAASPLHIKCSAPNLSNAHLAGLDQIVKISLEQSLNNRITS